VDDSYTDSGAAQQPAPSSSDWESRLADTIESTVAAVHDRLVRPLIIAARAAVFGIVVGSMALALSVLLSIALVRLLDTYAFGHRVWASEALVGAVLAGLGIVAWSLRRARHSTEGG